MVWDYQGVNSWGILPPRRWRRKQFPDPKRRQTSIQQGTTLPEGTCLPQVTYRTIKRPSATDVPSTNRLAISLHVLRCESLRRPNLPHSPLYSIPRLSSKPVSLEEKILKRIKQTNPHPIPPPATVHRLNLESPCKEPVTADL